MIRELSVTEIRETIAKLCKEANYFLPEDVRQALVKARKNEESPRAQKVLDMILQNAEFARENKLALCQDTGTCVVFLEIGQDVHITGELTKAIEQGVAKGYKNGYLRSSMVRQPFSKRVNTGDNTPAVIHAEIVPGEKLKITIMPKGGGCENMSRLGILKPGEGRDGVIQFVLRAVEEAGGNPCPPVIVGVGVGGTAEHVMFLAKRALLRKVGESNPDPEVAELERELLERINATGIGPQAWGGRTTALAVHVEAFPAHITALPVGVNLQCHSARIRTAEL